MRISDWISDVCSSDRVTAVQTAEDAGRVALAELFLDARALVPFVEIRRHQVDRRVGRRLPAQRAADRIEVAVIDARVEEGVLRIAVAIEPEDRKSTRLNSSH